MLRVGKRGVRSPQLEATRPQLAAMCERVLVDRSEKVGRRVADVLFLEVVLLTVEQVLRIRDQPRR